MHRDLKPSNVLLATDGPRVIDFGISLALERSMMTATGMVMGSPGFMSPEQARGQREVGAPTDVFSLGAVLAFAATGNGPFGTGPTPALLYRVVSEPPDLAGVPDRLSALIGQCLAKDPAERPTPTEILATLGDDVEVLTGEWLPPIIAESMSRTAPRRRPRCRPRSRSRTSRGRRPRRPLRWRLLPAWLPPVRLLPCRRRPRRTFRPRRPAAAVGGIGYEPTTLEPAVGAGRACRRRRSAPSRGPSSTFPDTSLVPVSGPLLLGSGGGASIPPLPPRRPPSRGRGRWGWLRPGRRRGRDRRGGGGPAPSHKPAGGKGGGGATASLAGDATQPAPTSSSELALALADAEPDTDEGGSPPRRPRPPRSRSRPRTYRTSSPTSTPTQHDVADADQDDVADDSPTSSPTTSPTTAPTTTPTTSTPTTPTDEPVVCRGDPLATTASGDDIRAQPGRHPATAG